MTVRASDGGVALCYAAVVASALETVAVDYASYKRQQLVESRARNVVEAQNRRNFV